MENEMEIGRICYVTVETLRKELIEFWSEFVECNAKKHSGRSKYSRFCRKNI